MFVAGYLGLYEVLLEFVLIAWTILKITNTVLEKQKKKNFKSNLQYTWKWFSTFKARKVEQVLNGHTILPFFQVVLLGWVLGWVVAIISLFFKDWNYVISREIKETILDIIISISLIKLATLFIKNDYVKKQEDSEMTNYHPLEPEAHDHLSRYGEAQNVIAVHWAGIFYFLKSSVLLTTGIISFVIGFIIQHFGGVIKILDIALNWKINSNI